MFDKIDELGVNAVRMLSLQSIAKANSGHPGLPLGAAPMTYVLYRNHLNVNPRDTKWFDRDRFILSAGHGSAMLYSMLHLAGFDLSIEALKNFRQLNSKTPGHPEYGVVDGVEATTGPLGQGLGMAVGMAMAETHLASQYNVNGISVMNHHTYALVGDGDLMEGISHEAASLAGHLRLGKLVVLYDSNDVSLDGPKNRSFNENIQKRFESYGWDYQRVEDGNDLNAIDQAITNAENNTVKPSIIEVRTVIGYGALNAGTNKVHGAPLCAEDMAAVKETLNWTLPDFEVPAEVYQRLNDTLGQRGAKLDAQWLLKVTSLNKMAPEIGTQFQLAMNGKLPADWREALPTYLAGTSEASRITSHTVIQALGKKVPQLWGGSADLASSNKTNMECEGLYSADNLSARNIGFGVREFAEAAAMNGIALHGGTRVFGSTFFVFSDYMRPAIRLAALQHLPVIYVLTHDSVAVGEDGPTHEPIEHLMSFRNMPNVTVLRPADPNETVAAWETAMTHTDGPTLLVLSRQNLAVLPGAGHETGHKVAKGAYVVQDVPEDKIQDGILIATGSEVNLALAAQAKLAAEDVAVSVVSVPSFELFQQQSSAYKRQVLPTGIHKRLSLELGTTLGWERFVGLEGKALGIDTFGASGPCGEVLEKFGFTVDQVVAQYLALEVENEQPAEIVQPQLKTVKAKN
ncbi:transketolase [Agrilactobacillus yilanensis]|uniref:Transketolase n=1 Tax=Agrilactobacillus yilanensis TaxID=2485997 RepID=A0ABW4J861_9LACO|nr:transketolase [Agrilactobacillus yilanensis]